MEPVINAIVTEFAEQGLVTGEYLDERLKLLETCMVAGIDKANARFEKTDA